MRADRLGLFHEVADAVAAAVSEVVDWGPSGGPPGQYAADLRADAAALEVLAPWGLTVLSEESGRSSDDLDLVVVMDPLDGSTNASRGIPWFATSLCLVEAGVPTVALVVDQASGRRWWAERGGGAWCDGVRLTPSSTAELADAVVGLSGLPSRHLGWRQFRAFGAVALDLCLVASGSLDAFVDCSHDAHGVWDYLGAVLICHEAGAVVTDAHGRDLVALDHAARRTPVAAATPELHAALVAARATFP